MHPICYLSPRLSSARLLEVTVLPFDYYKRLPRSQQRIYLKSDRISAILIPDHETLYPLVRYLEKALAAGNRPLTRKAAQHLVTGIIGSLKTRPLKVRVLERRPSNAREELHGLYQPGRQGESDQITLWMKTARKEQVVAFKTFLRILLHELCHHLDYEFLGLKETFHTEGFFKRESSLFHQVMREGKNPSKK